MYELRIKHLEEAHRALNKQIDTLEKTGVFEDLELEKMKKQRLQLKDKIAILVLKHQVALDEAAAENHARNNGLEL
jgi:uncharacterized protein YdcH (DUF465 family)